MTLNPPNEVKFKLSDDNRASMVGNGEPVQKALARIEIINKSKTAILFKVRWNIINYWEK